MSTMEEPLISIIIPTRERVETLRHTIKSALNQKSNAYEVIISDNCSEDGTYDMVASFDDARLRYINTGKRLSMCDNWEFALEYALGQYVVFIGDDDAIMPNSIDRLIQEVKAETASVYNWSIPMYVWPIDHHAARVSYLPPRHKPSVRNLKQIAEFVISHGGWRYYELPGIYHALVARKILDSIRNSTGRVFHTTQPDIFTSMVVPAFVQYAIHLDFPVTVNGHSAKSNGGSSIAKDGDQHLNRYIKEFGDYQVHSTLYPESPLAINMIFDCMLRAMDLFPDFYGEMTFNYTAMWAFACRTRGYSRWSVVRSRYEICKYHPFNIHQFLYYTVIHGVAVQRRRVLDRVTNTGAFDRNVPDNIDDFVIALSEWWKSPDSSADALK